MENKKQKKKHKTMHVQEPKQKKEKFQSSIARLRQQHIEKKNKQNGEN